MKGSKARALRREAKMVATFGGTHKPEKRLYKEMKSEYHDIKDAPVYKPVSQESQEEMQIILNNYKPKEKMDNQVLIGIAKVCHQANKAFCEANEDYSQKDWEEAEEWQKESAVKGVEFRINNPDAGHDAQHNSWMAEKVNDGWVFGEVKNAEAKTHPCIVPFEQLPKFQQQKDALFCAVVDSLK